MDNVKIYKKLVSLNLVRRGNWLIKVSVLNGQILLVASHTVDLHKIRVKTFWKPESTFDYIDKMLKE